MSGTSESSPSPDNSYESKRRSRKPDLRLYVPPKNSKRQNVIEQSKQDDISRRPSPLNFVDDNLLCTKKEKFRSPSPTHFSKTAGLFVLDDYQAKSRVVSAVIIDEVVRPDVPATTVRCYNRDRCFSSQNENEPQISPKKGLSGPPPQPDPTKLPQQQIEAMLKKYNIFGIKKDATPSSDTGFSPPSLTEEQTKSAYDDSSSPPSSSNDYNSLNIATIMNNDDVFCCDSGSSFDVMSLNLPAVSTRGQSQSSNSSFYSTSTACSNVNAPNNVSIPAVSCGRPITQRKYCDENEDDQMLSSLPKSYDEFVETKESTAVVAVAIQPHAFITQASHSPPCASQRTSSLNCGRVDSVVLTPSTSPSLVDPDDLEVQMINESFEDQVKQAQVLSDQKTKEAFYRQPNSTATVSSSSSCGQPPKRTLSTSSNQMSQPSTVVDDVTFAQPHSFSSVASTASLKSSGGSASTKFESFAFPSPHKFNMKKPPQTLNNQPTNTPNHQPPSLKEQTVPVSAEKGLTWASWGSGTPNSVPHPKITSTHEEGSLFASISCQSSAEHCLAADPPTHQLRNATNVAHTAIAVEEDTVNLEQFGEEMIASLLSDENELEFEEVLNSDSNASDGHTQCSQRVSMSTVNKCSVSIVSPSVVSQSTTPSTLTTHTAPVASFIAVPSTSTASLLPDVTTIVKRRFNVSDLLFKAVNNASVNDGAHKSSVIVRDDYQNDETIVERWDDIVDVDDFVPLLSQKAVSDFGLTGTPKTIDYLKFDFKKSVTLENDHVLEAYGFPACYHTVDDLKSAFQFECRVDFVDDSHALIILADRDIAFKALQYAHPVIKLRTLHDATAQSKRKAKENAAQMKPFKARPETNAFLARRLVESHLGKKSAVSNDARKQERVNIQSARETKRIVAQLKEDSWLGLN